MPMVCGCGGFGLSESSLGRVGGRVGIPGRSCLAKADMLGWTDPEFPPDARRLGEFSGDRKLARRTMN